MALTVDLEKRLGDFHLQANFQAGDEALALLGASGCGKSVTLKCIAGILRPDRGHIELDGKVLFDSRENINLPPQQRGVGYLFQQYALFPHMTVAQNIAAALHRQPKKGRAETARRVFGNFHPTGLRQHPPPPPPHEKKARPARARRLLETFHLTGLEQHYPAQLSGGQQQRVALVRILASKPQAILLDEPFSALDSSLKLELELELESMLEGFGGTVLWVSHDRAEVERHCRQVAVMERGSVGRVTTLEELRRNPATVAEARMAGCRNFTACTVSDGVLHAPGWGLTLPCPAKDGRYTLGLPDHALAPGANLHGVVTRRMESGDQVTVLLHLATGEVLVIVQAMEACPPIGSPLSLAVLPDRFYLIPSH